MFVEFDLNVLSDRIAILRRGQYGGSVIELRELGSDRLISEISQSFLPDSPRISPDGHRLAFFGDNALYIHDIRVGNTHTILENWGGHTGFCEWSPDGRNLVFSSCLDDQPPSICCINLDDGQPFRLTDDPTTVDRFPQWSPSGDSAAFMRQYLDEPSRPSYVCVADVGSGKTAAIPRPKDAWHRVNRFCWLPDSSCVLVTEQIGDRISLRAIRLDDMRVVWSFDAADCLGGAFAPDGRSVLCVCSDELLWVSFPDGVVRDRLSLGGCAPVRNTLRGYGVAFDPDREAAYFMGENSVVYRWDINLGCSSILEEPPMSQPEFEEEEYRITARDGRSIPVHRFILPNPKPIAVLFAIGGPGGVVRSRDSVILRLIAEGYEVIAPSYRGCAGYGQEHVDANIGEYGRADVQDVVDAGCDWKQRFGQDRPLAVVGYSYGGFLTFLALTQPDAAWVCGITLWGVTVFMPAHEQRYFPSDPEERTRAMIERSPVEQAGCIKHPLLILHGGRDTLASDDDVRAIQRKVQAAGLPCDLVVFEDDTHGLNKHRDEMYRYMFDFLEKFCK